MAVNLDDPAINRRKRVAFAFLTTKDRPQSRHIYRTNSSLTVEHTLLHVSLDMQTTIRCYQVFKYIEGDSLFFPFGHFWISQIRGFLKPPNSTQIYQRSG